MAGKANRARRKTFVPSLASAGPSTGAGGMGRNKARLTAQEQDPSALAVMRDIKHTPDSKNIFKLDKRTSPFRKAQSLTRR